MDYTPPPEPVIVEVSTDGTEWTELLPISNVFFMVNNDNTRFRFEADESGQINIMYIVIEGLNLPATRID